MALGVCDDTCMKRALAFKGTSHQFTEWLRTMTLLYKPTTPVSYFMRTAQAV